ncbi:hypothetical protein A5853_002544, partial [Enterococcus faecium]
DGTLFVGRAALMDTMGDLLTNTIGAALMGLFASRPSYPSMQMCIRDSKKYYRKH